MFRRGDADNAFHGLLEIDHDILPELILRTETILFPYKAPERMARPGEWKTRGLKEIKHTLAAKRKRTEATDSGESL
jgi:hypothetical protein